MPVCHQTNNAVADFITLDLRFKGLDRIDLKKIWKHLNSPMDSTSVPLATLFSRLRHSFEYQARRLP